VTRKAMKNSLYLILVSILISLSQFSCVRSDMKDLSMETYLKQNHNLTLMPVGTEYYFIVSDCIICNRWITDINQSLKDQLTVITKLDSSFFPQYKRVLVDKDYNFLKLGYSNVTPVVVKIKSGKLIEAKLVESLQQLKDFVRQK
jgi:hypothetical protein